MTLVIRVTGADWSAAGLPNIYPFVAVDALAYGFDFRNRSTMLTDVTGQHTITPKRNDPAGGVVNVTDPTIITPVLDGQGIRVDLGYLQSSKPIITFAAGNAGLFTFMVVGTASGATFPPEKVAGGAPLASILLDNGSVVSPTGFSIDNLLAGGSFPGRKAARIESSGVVLNPEISGAAIYSPCVQFLTYNGVNWSLYNKTRGVSATGTNAQLSVGDPMAVTTSANGGRINLGGSGHPSSTLHAHSPILFQSAMWNRVLTPTEMEAQYQRTKAGRPSISM